MSSGSETNQPPQYGSAPGYAISGKIMMSAILCLFLVVLIVFLLHLYARWIWQHSARFSRGNRRRSASRRRRLRFSGQIPASLRNTGLDSAILQILPMFVYKSQDFIDGLECAVCLCELEENEKARLLPNCKHGFHVECIDMWFRSHSTCPLCRTAAKPEPAVSDSAKIEQVSITISGPIPSEVHDNSGQAQSVRFGEDCNPPNWPKQVNAETDQGTSGGRNVPQIGIEVPKRPDGLSFPGEGCQLCSPNGSQSSSKSPVTLLRSLTRMLSRDTERIQVFPTDHPGDPDVENNCPAQSQ